LYRRTPVPIFNPGHFFAIIEGYPNTVKLSILIGGKANQLTIVAPVNSYSVLTAVCIMSKRYRTPGYIILHNCALDFTAGSIEYAATPKSILIGGDTPITAG